MITEGYLARHYQGRRGGRDPALLDVAQDYALKIVHNAGLFDLGLTFKGGTALRKYRVGAAGRFSTDLDFAGEESGLGELLFETLDGTVLHEVRFSVGVVTPGRRAKLQVETPIGNPRIDARIEVSPRAPWLTPERVQPVPFPVHRGYEFVPVSLPIMVLEEILAEKLAAFRRRALLRDLYDLALYHQGAFDTDLVRRLTYLKVYTDVVEDGLGGKPFDPSSDLLAPKRESDFPPEDLGVLTGEVNVSLWLDRVHTRFRFLLEPTEEESRWGQCDPRDAREVRLLIESLRASTSIG